MRLFFIFVFTLTSYLIYGQSYNPASKKLYQEAYLIIKSDTAFQKFRGSSSCVAVFDSIVHLNQLNFAEELGRKWKYSGYKKMNRLHDSLSTLDASGYHKPYFSRLTARLTSTSGTDKGCMVVMFSRLSNDMLLAEVSNNQDGGPSVRSILSLFDQSIIYLFLIGPDSKIQQYYTQFVSYN
ncbi:hypothetical protein MTX78_11945 [Hymenobacter tibetensis]|uniref:DUF4252 domain-containing protein n=1 Tax=Hymenobacter tibetensis TaxID=497967 RepID=A0ABY4CV02_9BACT|nr:hypothetical protein [Hymenobacter tibetensis]UOG72839.1 hypothetical protein MTX78_11945 [Hymenobacter tibetensis]